MRIGSAARVLLVCDDPRLRDQVRRSAIELGAVPAHAESAERALRLLSHQPYDIAIIDLNLRSGAGGDLLETIKQRWAWLQVILLGALADDEATRHTIRFGAHEFLTRPCSQREIVAAMSRAYRRRIHDSASPMVNVAIPAPSDGNIEPEPLTPLTTEPASLGDVERVHILAALQRHRGNREAAASELGISVRKLYYRLQQYHRDGLIK